MNRPLTPEQLLAIADEFCLIYKVRIRSFSALAACAAAPGARIHGVPVCESVAKAGKALHQTIKWVKPLTHANAEFAQISEEIYVRWAKES